MNTKLSTQKSPGRAKALCLLVAWLWYGSLCTSSVEAQATKNADRIFVGGRVYTGVDAMPTAEAVAVRDGRIIAVGSRAHIDELRGEKTERVDLEGATLFPGFVDAHAHLQGIGMRELTLNLDAVGSVAELVTLIRNEVARTGNRKVIFGRGWLETNWPEARFPHRRDLDAVSPRNPVVLFRADGHSALANSVALELAGISRSTPDPNGGRIERDSNGEPTGILIDSAKDILTPLVQEITERNKEEQYQIGARVYMRAGWTGLHNLNGASSGRILTDDLTTMTKLAARGELPIRVYNLIDPSALEWLIEHGPYTDATGRIRARGIKLYVDGALGSRGAALFKPYADRPDTSGLLMMREDEAHEILTRALRRGVQVGMHAIGDRGNALALDWMERAFNAVPVQQRTVTDPRWRIEHAQVLRPQDFPRFRQLHVIASMQPSHAISDLYFAPARLGTERLSGAYAWRTLLDQGALIAGGSDAPTERGDPRIEFYAAVAREDLNGRSGSEWHPELAVTRIEALRMFTLWPAYASFDESQLGTIEVGKLADFTVFSKDLMTVPESEILTATAVMTVVGGEVVHRSKDERK